MTKEFVDRKPVSWYTLRVKGRKALRSHLDVMSRLVVQVGRPPRG